MADTIQVKGIRELQRAFRVYDKDLAKRLRAELKDVGTIVQVAARGLFSPISLKSAAGYRVRVRQRGVSVEQSLRKTTGFHPSYGSLQMQRALLPALEANQSLVVERVEQMLDTLESETF